MRQNWRAVTAALAVIGLAAVIVPATVGAQKVLNPGSFTLDSTGGSLKIGTVAPFDLTPRQFAQCGDGIDNDGDGKVDADDAQCAAGPSGQPKSDDDSELVSGFQAKVETQISGSVTGAGVVTVLPANIKFPPAYIPIVYVDGVTYPVKAEVLATQNATGTIDPLSGDVSLDVRVRVKLTGNIGGAVLQSTTGPNGSLISECTIGTAGSPVRVQLTTGTKPAIGSNPSLTGSKYNSITGNAVIVDNAFSVPGVTQCFAGFIDVTTTINSQTGIPSAAGNNTAVIAGKTTPVLAKAIQPKITTGSTLGGAAPQTFVFSGATSTVAKPTGASYVWNFSDGTTLSGIEVVKTFNTSGAQFARLTITDTDGDSNQARVDFLLDGATTTTTTTSTTTTAPTTTTTPTTTTSTTTTAPTTTTTPTTTTSTTTTAPTTTTSTTTTAPTTTTSTTTTTAPTTTTSTTTTTAPTTTTTTTAPTTTTTTSTTTTTAPTTTTSTAPTTTTTTTAPTTTTTTSTTSTTVPQPSSDSVAVRVNGALTYSNQGSGTGGFTIARDTFGIRAVLGSLTIPGANGGSARVTVTAQRAWILPLWTGEVSTVDAGAAVALTAPIFGSVTNDTAPNSAKGTSNWFVLGNFPNLIRPYTISWSVIDAG
jgi:hypothetical protein